MTTPSRDLVQRLPKVELHVHLEGTFSAARIVEMADEVGEALPRPVDELFRFDDLSSFLEFLDWTCALVRTSEMAERAAYEFASRAHADGTRYAEVIVNPTHWSGWELAPLVEAFTVGFERAEADGLTSCALLLSILRTQTADDAMALVEWMGEHRPRRVVGLSIDGDESRTGPTAERFAPAYALAGVLGFGLTAHAGESSGADGVRAAVEQLGVSRVDHGVKAIEDDAVVELLIDRAITLNVCVSSNLELIYGDEADHPLPALDRAGVRVTVNTDDPAYMDTSLVDEFLRCARMADWVLDDLVAVTRCAIAASFCDPSTAHALHAALDDFLLTLDPPPDPLHGAPPR